MKKIYICTHTDFDCPVKNKIYEVADVRGNDMADNGLRGSFYSELLTHKRIADRRHRKGDIIGFCGYRKYFGFMDDIPDLKSIIKERGCVTISPIVFPFSLREQYASCLNVEDLDIVTGIIDEHHKDFAPAWKRAINGSSLHAGNLYIMGAAEQKEMLTLVWDILDKYISIVGDIDDRIKSNPQKYMHLAASAKHEYQYRIGGHIGERIVSAWIDWKFPNAMCVEMVATSDAK